MKIVKISFFAAILLSIDAFPQLSDSELSNRLLEMTSFGSKESFTVAELREMETLIQRLSDNSVRQVWTANIVGFALLSDLPNTPPRANCEIANRNIDKLEDESLKSIWVSTYSLSGC